MRAFDRARALFVATIGSGAALLAIALVKSAEAPFAVLALFGAAVVLTEIVQVRGDDESLDPVDAYSFSFSFGVQIAAVLVLGPWPAALVAAFGVLVVDPLRGSSARHLAFNAGVFSLMPLVGGLAFELAGGQPGQLQLPHDFAAVFALVACGYGVNTLLVGAMVSLSSGTSLRPFQLEKLRFEFSSVLGEMGLGVALAVFARTQPWAAVALVPLVVAVYQSKARLADLRRETAHALETFANVVDERDPHTYRHSARVAAHVQRLAEALGFPASRVARLRWAGRLHDLGKIAVDAQVLRKSGRLDDDEWVSMHRHPRLSARLLRRFRFASDEAQAVEYHHERVDGGGYYGVPADEIPLAAHFLIVADSFDAMISDRPYRRGLDPERALSEIEAQLGSQFHPSVGKAFVALQRGRDPLEVLSPAELAELQRLALRGVRKRLEPVRYLREHPELLAVGGIVGMLFAVGMHATVPAVAALVVALVGLLSRLVAAIRAHRLIAALRAALAEDAPREHLFSELVGSLAGDAQLSWAGLVSWRDSVLGGAVELEWNHGPDRPPDAALTSWLIREAEAREELLAAAGSELGRSGAYLAVPLRRGRELAGFLVLGFARSAPASVASALRECRGDLAEALAPPFTVEPAASRPPLAAVS